MKLLVLTIDAFGGYGGIAQYNRDLLRALCEHPRVDDVVAIPRYVERYDETLPLKLRYVTSGVGGKLRYTRACLRVLASSKRIDFIFCAHINLLPLANFIGQLARCPVVPIVYGVEAWTPNRKWLINRACRSIKRFISIRALTAQRFSRWAKLEDVHWDYLPNCIDTDVFKPMPKDASLIARYGIANKTVVMAAGRLSDVPHEKFKGFDEILDVLPDLRRELPSVVYLIVGDGPDMPRLKARANQIGVADIVIFVGRISAEDKPAHFCLADVFAMPGSNRNFDRYPLRFVFLEALACGVPVVGSQADGSGESHSPEGKLIVQVDPNDRNAILHGILDALDADRDGISRSVEPYNFESHRKRVIEIVDQLLSTTDSASAQ